MRVLMVGMVPSIHLARLVRGLPAMGVEVALFPSFDGPVNPAFNEVTILAPAADTKSRLRADLAVTVIPAPPRLVPSSLRRTFSLARAIRSFRPDIVHSHEMHYSGHLTASAYRLLRHRPPFVQSIWGSDLYLRQRIPRERRRIQKTLSRIDVLIMECRRDQAATRSLGFAGVIAEPMSVAGGFDFEQLQAFRSPGPTSARRVIAVKGYQHFAGRAQVALHAIELLGERLKGYRLAIYSTNSDEEALARRAARRGSMEFELVSRNTAWVPHDEMLRLHGRARISIGLSVADGASMSFLESLAMGSFPIQSGTACVSEWLTDGVGGMIVPPEDPYAVADAIERAVNDDALVDRAAELNRAVARERLDDAVLRQKLVEIYGSVLR